MVLKSVDNYNSYFLDKVLTSFNTLITQGNTNINSVLTSIGTLISNQLDDNSTINTNLSSLISILNSVVSLTSNILTNTSTLITNSDTINTSITTADTNINNQLVQNAFTLLESRNIYNETISSTYEIVVQNTAISRQLSTALYQPFTNGLNSSITVDNTTGEILITSGPDITNFALLRSKRVATYRAGFSNICRFACLYDTPQVNAVQFAGVANSQSDLYVGYNGLDFGVRISTNGLQHSMKLTINTSTAGGAGQSLSLTLNGTLYTIPLTANANNNNFTALEISKFNFLPFWVASSENNNVVLTATTAGVRNGTYSAVFNATAATGTLSTLINGNPLTTTFIPLASCNGDSSIINNLNPQLYNLYSIEYAYYGSSPIVISVLDFNVNRYKPIHTFRFNNLYTHPNLSNPNFYISRFVSAVSGSLSLPITMKTLGSFLATISGNIPRMIGREPTFSVSNEVTASGTFPVLSLKHRDYSAASGAAIYSEFVVGLVSISNTGTKPSVISIYRNAQSIGLDTVLNFTNWTPINSSSITLYDTQATTFGAGVGVSPILSFVLQAVDSVQLRLDSYGIFFGTGDTMVIVASNSQSTTILTSIQVIESTN